MTSRTYKLHEVPRKTRIRIVGNGEHPPAHRDFEPNEELNFCHVDGLYSLCFDDEGQAVHLMCTTEVEIVGDYQR